MDTSRSIPARWERSGRKMWQGPGITTRKQEAGSSKQEGFRYHNGEASPRAPPATVLHKQGLNPRGCSDLDRLERALQLPAPHHDAWAWGLSALKVAGSGAGREARAGRLIEVWASAANANWREDGCRGPARDLQPPMQVLAWPEGRVNGQRAPPGSFIRRPEPAADRSRRALDQGSREPAEPTPQHTPTTRSGAMQALSSRSGEETDNAPPRAPAWCKQAARHPPRLPHLPAPLSRPFRRLRRLPERSHAGGRRCAGGRVVAGRGSGGGGACARPVRAHPPAPPDANAPASVPPLRSAPLAGGWRRRRPATRCCRSPRRGPRRPQASRPRPRRRRQQRPRQQQHHHKPRRRPRA